MIDRYNTEAGSAAPYLQQRTRDNVSRYFKQYIIPASAAVGGMGGVVYAAKTMAGYLTAYQAAGMLTSGIVGAGILGGLALGALGIYKGVGWLWSKLAKLWKEGSPQPRQTLAYR